MRTSNLLPEECKKEIKVRLIELEVEKHLNPEAHFDNCISLLKWVLENDKK